MNKNRQAGFAHVLIFVIIIFIAILFVFGMVASRKTPNNPISKLTNKVTGSSSSTNPWGEPCHSKEEGRRELTTSPIKFEDIDTINPMGLMVGGHVTPIDHMYFYPKSTPGNRFSAKVFAMADGYITSVQHRGDITNGPADARPGSDEFRMTIEQTCSQGYYYDLITKLAPGITEGKNIKAGDLIGYVGNQSLDFGVYDTKVNLNFIVPEHYSGEQWKIHTADAFKYFEPNMLKTLEPKMLRFAEPRAGKIDFDKDGYLSGNWFEKGSNGYSGNNHMSQDYFKTHVAFAYDAYDTTGIIISVGFLVKPGGGQGGQYYVVGNSPDPVNVSTENGIVKYELTNASYVLPDGSNWDRRTPKQNIKVVPNKPSQGTLLVQLTGKRELKLEYFAGKTPAEVSNFTANANYFER